MKLRKVLSTLLYFFSLFALFIFSSTRDSFIEAVTLMNVAYFSIVIIFCRESIGKKLWLAFIPIALDFIVVGYVVSVVWGGMYFNLNFLEQAILMLDADISRIFFLMLLSSISKIWMPYLVHSDVKANLLIPSAIILGMQVYFCLRIPVSIIELYSVQIIAWSVIISIMYTVTLWKKLELIEAVSIIALYPMAIIAKESWLVLLYIAILIFICGNPLLRHLPKSFRGVGPFLIFGAMVLILHIPYSNVTESMLAVSLALSFLAKGMTEAKEVGHE
jgi:hypothetical protein